MDSLGGDFFVKPEAGSKTVPKVVIDARMVVPQAHGIGRYVKNLAVGLAEIAKNRDLTYEPVFLVDHRYSGLLPSALESVPVQAQFLNPSELFEIPSVLKRVGADLYHSPSFSSLAHSPCPWVATVHDLNHLKFGNTKQKIYYNLLLKRFAKKARSLLTVSEFAQQELCDWLSLPSSRIDVVYNALEAGFSGPMQALGDSSRAEFQQLADRKGWKVHAGDYLICLSNPKPHKNLQFLVEAYSQAVQTAKASGRALPPLLLSVSPGEISAQAEGVICTSHLNDVEAKLVLAHARAAVFPALYEGFGLGPLETIVSGTPVLVSDIAPHREGLIDFLAHPEGTSWAKWLSPDDLQKWAENIGQISLATPVAMRADTRFLATREAALDRFSVKRLAEHMDRVYTGVLGVKS